MPSTPQPEGKRFAAKLLFQFRVVVDGDSGVMRTCEERIIVFRASTARKALATAKRRGRAAQHTYENDAGRTVYFEFVGIQDLLHLGLECEEDEVWYNITQRKLPMERAASILPPEGGLNAIRNSGL
ncbi:hypothetical protein RHOFW104T7_08850 [Rhodanobacter thiooxydans]|uniref:DUF4288 domain-containing protein n=1 Tax=Rhodanobacter thiooxydans TaxID=416169 RepID=A0A154QJM8_9GAMM|nr:DUF4288 domain-containing protein [Rhodanobacter thiooxydans]KZC24388.1 hypothetical protein RHOFW104T7_08850 [Rhodanobacter thiooxydans]MCW0200759.1 DUF4288 domain-containing protein [Rhodanobacter thiooxydans]